MSRSRIVGALSGVLLVAAIGVLVAEFWPERVPRLESCEQAATDYVMPPALNYQLKSYRTPEGTFQYYSRDSSIPSTSLVVLVAGFPEPHYFDAVIAPLLQKNRVLVLDLPGKGHTRLSRPPTAAFIVGQFQRLLAELNLQNTTSALIVGTSIGSPVAALLAARWHGPRPRLALVSALGMKRSWNQWHHPFLVSTSRIPVLSDLLAPFVLPWLTEDNWRTNEILCPQNFPKLFARQRDEFTGPYSAINYLELTRALVLTDQTPVYDELNHTTVPVWLVNGKSDPFFDQIRPLKALLRNAEVKTPIDNAAHIPFIEQPAETLELLQTFLTASF